MELTISFKQIDPSDALRTYAAEKSEKLAKYFRGRITIHWIFSQDKMLNVAHCHLIGNNMDYFGQAETENLYSAVDAAIEKIERQLRKHKEIVRDHLHRNGHRLPTAS
jgi:putative sigma-54 modulation protein